jgi:hypothetical protein
MLLILWSACLLVCCASMTVDLALRRRPQNARQARYGRLAEISVLVVATGGIVSYFVNEHQVPGNYHLRMAADALQLAGYIGAASFSLRRRVIARKARAGGPRQCSDPD